MQDGAWLVFGSMTFCEGSLSQGLPLFSSVSKHFMSLSLHYGEVQRQTLAKQIPPKKEEKLNKTITQGCWIFGTPMQKTTNRNLPKGRKSYYYANIKNIPVLVTHSTNKIVCVPVFGGVTLAACAIPNPHNRE